MYILSLKNSLGLEIGPVQASAKVEMKMFVFTFSRKFIFAFRKNLLTKIDENYKDFREIENAKTETPFHVSNQLLLVRRAERTEEPPLSATVWRRTPPPLRPGVGDVTPPFLRSMADFYCCVAAIRDR
jgi:hypothetical protein